MLAFNSNYSLDTKHSRKQVEQNPIDHTSPVIMTSNFQYVVTRPVLEARTALMEASKSGDLERVISLVTEWPGRHWDREYLEFGLYAAFRANQLQVARYLLNCGGQLEDMVVSSAAHSRSLLAFELMVEYGWNVNAPMRGGSTALGYVRTVIALLETGDCQATLKRKGEGRYLVCQCR
jgi:hypothetical protein